MPPLRIGMVGDDVVSLQLALIAIGLVAGPANGAFDQVTQRAVIELQRRSNLPQTGVMDDATWNALYQMQASVAPSDDGGVTYGPRKPGTIEGDTTAITGAPSQGQLLFWGLLAGGAYYWAHNQKEHGDGAVHEYDEDDDEDEEDEEEDDDFEDDEDDDEDEPPQRSMRDYDDAVTDSLIDEPAVVSASGRPGDCKKAAMLLLRRQGLVQRPSERELQRRVIGKVAQNCREHEEVLEAAIEEEQDRRDEAESEIGTRLIRSPADVAPGTSHEPGFRKSKKKLTKKTTSERETQRSSGKGQGHRRGASAVDVRREGKSLFKMRKEKAKTKRGYTWRKEEGD